MKRAVYTTNEICELFGIHKNRIDVFIDNGTIPNSLPNKPNAKRLWVKSEVDRYLGITDEIEMAHSVQEPQSVYITNNMEVVKQEIKETLNTAIMALDLKIQNELIDFRSDILKEFKKILDESKSDNDR